MRDALISGRGPDGGGADGAAVTGGGAAVVGSGAGLTGGGAGGGGGSALTGGSGCGDGAFGGADVVGGGTDSVGGGTDVDSVELVQPATNTIARISDRPRTVAASNAQHTGLIRPPVHLIDRA